MKGRRAAFYIRLEVESAAGGPPQAAGAGMALDHETGIYSCAVSDPGYRQSAMSLLHHRWLAEQLPAWERDGIITAENAQTLRARYMAEPRGGLAQMIVGAVGALLIGTGLIAVLAYNWDDFPRGVRLALALGPLAASQVVSWRVLSRGESARPWMRESAALVQTLAAGAAMAIVSQIYNLPGVWTDLVFRWCVVTVPLAWVLRSQAVAIAYLLGIAIWTIAQVADRGLRFSTPAIAAVDVRLWYPLLLAGILPLWPGPGLRERPAVGSRLVLAATAFVGLLAVAAAAKPDVGDASFSWLAMLTAAAMLLFPLDRAGIAEPLMSKPQVVIGGLALVFTAFVATYEEPAHHLVESVGFAWLLLAVTAGAAALAGWQGRLAVLTVAAVAVLPLAAAPLTPTSGWPVAIAYSLALLATAIVLIGLEFLGRQGAARLGGALITILVILRMADADVSLLVKGLVFILVGSGFLAFNAFITRHRRVTASGGTPA